MSYKLKTRKSRPFELYNNLEIGDIVEIGFFLFIGEAPRMSLKKVVAEHLWVEIRDLVFESNDIYKGVLTEEPKYLKRLRRGDPVSFSPENVLTARSKKTQKKVKGIQDFVYNGHKSQYAAFKQVIADNTHCYAINPSAVVLRSSKPVKDAIPYQQLDEQSQKEFEILRERFEKVDLDKFHVKVDAGFVKASAAKIKQRSTTQSSPSAPAPLIRIADRSYLSFNLVGKLLVVLKKMLVYLSFHEDFPMLYFINNEFDGFISLAEHTSESIVVDFLEK